MNKLIEAMLQKYPIYEYAYITPNKLPFSDKVRYICESNCDRYGKNWACPPYIGSVQEGMKKCMSYTSGLIFSTIHEVPDAYNYSISMEAKREHEQITRELAEEFRVSFPDFLPLASGCCICDECVCPVAPCRHPEQRISSVESHGIVIMRALEEAGLSIECDASIATYYSVFLYNEPQ